MFMRSLGKFLLMLLFSSSIVAAVDIPGSGGVECSLSIDIPVVGALEPLWLNIICVNRLATSYTLLLGPGSQVGLRLHPPAVGKGCWSTVADDPLRNEELSLGEIAPHARASLRVLLNSWFRLSGVGKFNAVLIDCRGSREGEDPGGETLTNEVTFEVLPLDEERLAASCNKLAQDALGSDADKAKEAARTLSRIDSAVAVPYLKKILDANVFASSFVVAGLAHINSPETIRILIDSFEKAGGVTRMRIKHYLYAMKPQVADPVLRDRLDSILSWQPELVE